jgi:protein CpxP
MRKLLCGVALGAFLAITANLASAQSSETTPPPPPPGGWHHGPMNPAMQAAHLAKRLGLNSEQHTQVEAVLTSEQNEHKALEANTSITHQQFMTQSKALHEQTQTKIEALLTDTQKQEFAQMKAHRPGPPPAEGDAAPPQ